MSKPIVLVFELRCSPSRWGSLLFNPNSERQSGIRTDVGETT
jgi:hypothetical protein